MTIPSQQLLTGQGSSYPIYPIKNSLRFRKSASAGLSRTPLVAGNRQTWTWSGWVKRGLLCTTTVSTQQPIFSSGHNSATDTIQFDCFYDYNSKVNGITVGRYTFSNFYTSAVFRDNAAWYHICAVFDATQAVANDRWKLYINGVLQTNNALSGSFAQNTDQGINSTNIQEIGNGFGDYTFDGYMAEINFIDTPILVGTTVNGSTTITLTSGATTNIQVGWFVGGTNVPSGATVTSIISSTTFTISSAATGSGSSINIGVAPGPTFFGAYDPSGIWIPTKYTSTYYGTCGYYLPFSDTTGTSANIFTYSDQFDNAAWSKYQSSVTANATTAPDGTTTADKLVGTNATTGDHQVYRTYTAADNTNYTISVYAKAAEQSTVRLYIQNKAAAYPYADFNLSTGVVSATSGGATATIISAGNNWYRVTVTSNSSTGATATPVGIISSSFNGNGTDGIYIWGAQFEASSTVGYYRATTTAALTAVSNIAADQSIGLASWNFWTPANISTTSGATYDAMLDSPTNYPDNTAYGNGSYATLSPIWFSGSVSYLSAANLNVSAQNTNRYTGTIGLTSGKWYFEVTRTDALGGGNYIAVGAVTANTVFSANTYGGNPTSSGGNATEWVFTDRGTAVNNATYTNLSGTVGPVVQNDIVQVCIDMGTSSIWFGRNNTFSGSPSAGTGAAFTNLSSIMLPLLYTSSGASVASLVANFGQRPFTYTPPTGFMAINTANLPTPPISEGANYMAAVTYTGNGSGSTQIVATSANSGNNALAATFQPDLVWIKSRSATTNHNVFDSVRGATNYIITNTSAADASNINSLTAFNTNGFTLGSDASSIGVNVNAATYVAWEWLAGAGSSSIPTGGTITPTGASINRTAGFSVITYTGTGANATIPHGLGATPAFILIKDRTSASNGGAAYHTSLGATQYLKLFQTTTGSDAATTDNTVWNGGSPTFNSTVFSVGTNVRTNTTDNYVAYCWTSIPGYSAFGSYTGNGLADGPFVYLGFRPRWIVVKDTSAAHIWVIIDTSRDTINVSSKRLVADLSDAENTADTTVLDVLSNGFKLRSGNVHQNNGTNIYVYAAFAENPFKIARAR